MRCQNSDYGSNEDYSDVLPWVIEEGTKRVLNQLKKTMPPPSKRAQKVKPESNNYDNEGFDYGGPEDINVPPTDFKDFMLCLYGQKGIGKTTLASQFPKHYTLMLEPLRKNLSIRMKNLVKHNAKEIMEGAKDTWKQVLHTTQRMIDDETIDGINFDSVDIFYECCCHSINASHGVSRPSEAGKGGSDIWLEIRDEWSAYFDTLAASRLGVVLLSHAKTREVEEIDGAKMDISAPSCSPACLQYIKQACDFVFHYGRKNGERVMCVRDATQMTWVACGVEKTFMQPNGKSISYLPMPELTDKVSGFQRLVEAFDNKCWDLETPVEDRSITKGPPLKKGPPKK